jgi:glycosyltransferase involved in cell wall biosynthesis
VAAFTGGRDNPSSRFRVRQYVSPLVDHGIVLHELTSPLNSSPPVAKWIRPLWGCASLACDVPHIALSWTYDVCLLQRELINTLLTLEPLTKKPRILDVDDAIFVYRNGWPARKLAQLSDRVVCGNSYLAEWFGKWNPNIAIVPTAVDTDKLIPRKDAKTGANGHDAPVIGWIGGSSNSPYLASIEKALARVLALYPQARLRIVGDLPPALDVPVSRVDWVQWTERGEVAAIQNMDIGIMPLDDTTWTRGKCSYKMLQYMACGLPVVVSPVGMNAQVLALGECGFGARTESQWVESLVALIEDRNLRQRLGAVGRGVVESNFSIQAVAPKLARCLLASA